MSIKKEKVIMSAIHYIDNKEHVHQPINIDTGFVLCGMRHHNCIYTFKLLANNLPLQEVLILKQNNIQGFLTNNNRFVDRQEAAQIALESGQVIKLLNPDIGLFSEDLY